MCEALCLANKSESDKMLEGSELFEGKFGEFAKRALLQLSVDAEAKNQRRFPDPGSLNVSNQDKRNTSPEFPVEISEHHPETLVQPRPERNESAEISHDLTEPEASRTEMPESDSPSRRQLNSNTRSGYSLSLLPPSIVNRDENLRDIIEGISQNRVFILHGAGGIGKTLLALLVKSEIEKQNEETCKEFSKVYFVGLVDLKSAGSMISVLEKVATSVALPPDQTSLDSLAHYLSKQKCVLILDNVEHILGDCRAFVAGLLRKPDAANIHILVTTRIDTLGFVGFARTYSVPPFSQEQSLQLFQQRAERNPQYQSRSQDREHIIAICNILDRLPLAIELAAARTKDKTVIEIRNSLTGAGNPFSLLDKGDESKPSHQQTIEATLRWSYELLSDPEKSLLYAISVFRGGWDSDALVAICWSDNLTPAFVLDVQYELINHSFVQAVHNTETDAMRFRMHEITRQFATNVDSHNTKMDTLRPRHHQHFCQLALDAEPHLNRPTQKQWLDKLEANYGNLCAALDWCEEIENTEGRLQMAVALFRYFAQRGPLSDGVKYSKFDDTDPAKYAKGYKALTVAGTLAMNAGNLDEAKELLEKSLGTPSQTKDGKWILANSKVNLALLAMKLKDYNRAISISKEAIPICQEVGAIGTEAQCYNILGKVATIRYDCAEALKFHRKARMMWKMRGDSYGLAHTYECLGDVAAERKKWKVAYSYYERGEKKAAQINNKPVIVACLEGQARAAKQLGDMGKSDLKNAEAASVRKSIGMPVRTA